NHLTVPSATTYYSLLDDYKLANRRSARNTSTESARICKLAAPISRTTNGVLEQAGDRHRPDAARNGRQAAGDLGRARVDVADEARVGAVDAHVDNDGARLDHVGRDHPGNAHRGHEHVRVE